MIIQKFFEQAESSEKVPELKLSFKRTQLDSKRLVTTEEQVDFLMKVFDPDTFEIQEEMVLLILNDSSRPVCYYRIAKGNENSVEVMYKPLMAALLTLHAKSFIIAHNHPHKNPLPSFHDILFAHNLGVRSAMFGIDFDDSIIISKLQKDVDEDEEGAEFPHFFSLRDNGLFFDGDFPG